MSDLELSFSHSGPILIYESRRTRHILKIEEQSPRELW